MARLAGRIAEADRAYFQNDDPVMSDGDYDALRRRHAAIEARFPRLRQADSPTVTIGAAPAEGFAKVTHARRMLSLENAFSDADVADDVEAIITGEPRDLIETVAGEIADTCLEHGKVERVTVTVHKPRAPLSQSFADVSVTISRSK